MNNHNQEPTVGDVLDAINEFSTRVEERFSGIEQRLDRMGVSLFEIRSEIEGINKRLDSLEIRWKEDADAAAQELLILKKRINILENQVKRFIS